MKIPGYVQLAACLVGTVIAVPPFPSDIRGQQWVRVGYPNMSDPARQCPIPWKRFLQEHCAERKPGPVRIATHYKLPQMEPDTNKCVEDSKVIR